MPEGKSEYPDDVVAAAREAMNIVRGDGAVGVISRAILAERQRCAETAEEYSCKLSAYPNQEAFNYYESGVLDASVGIKWLILNPKSSTEER